MVNDYLPAPDSPSNVTKEASEDDSDDPLDAFMAGIAVINIFYIIVTYLFFTILFAIN